LANLLGTSWISQQGEEKPYRVDVSSLTGGAVSELPGDVAIRSFFEQLVPEIERAGLAPLKRGRIFINKKRVEAGLYLNHGLTQGAVVLARCDMFTREVEVTVARSSALLRGFVWGVLGVCIVAGVALARTLFPSEWEAVPKLVGGLLIGIVVAVPLLMLAGRMPMLAGGQSGALREQLKTCVKKRLDELEAP
jgi:hypothetical protein